MARRRVPARGRKSIFDPVHGTVVLEGTILDLVGTTAFQRLWGIRQTGFAHLVFPGANHTRLEHSLGTSSVAGRVAERLGLTAEETELARTAALLHDLGHGPFSHTLDGPMQEVLGETHEGRSRALILGTAGDGVIPSLLQKAALNPIRVADLVDPRPGPLRASVLRQILHGAVDADRIDYLQRDAHYTGVAHGAIDAARLLDTMHVARGRLVFAEKGRSAVEGFLVGRALMYSSVYYHKTVRAAEMMAQAALERIPGYPETAREAFDWTDGEWLYRVRASGGVSADLVERLLARHLYKRVQGQRTLLPAPRRAWSRFLAHPVERRRLEDEMAARAHAPAGSVLIDLAGLVPRGDPVADWGEIGLLEDGRVTYPFRQPSVWLLLATRPPSEWAVTVFADARYRSAVERVVARDPSFLP
ncbi:MAG: HD domain-containing protein [Thermoplasmata archaeon]|jgi:HD superfamily phosphohydrolase|nr:HD domain-containing protein [Thermoplasmata archaeon]